MPTTRAVGSTLTRPSDITREPTSVTPRAASSKLIPRAPEQLSSLS